MSTTATKTITVIDYGMGNLYSVQRAIEHCGFTPKLVSTPQDIEAADIVVLPGVGAFADAMAELKQRNLIEALQTYAKSGKPLISICLGMQLLFDSAEEFGHHQGLGIISGQVKAIPNVGENGKTHKIPHMGWNQLHPNTATTPWADSILNHLEDGDDMYFVHSFAVYPTNPQHQLAWADYDGCNITAVVKAGNIYGCQFHPEKSGPKGLQILENFLKQA